MSLPPESLEVGKCYLADARMSPQVWHVIRIFPDRRLEYKHRPASGERRHHWTKAVSDIRVFASFVTREVPCDWTPESEG